MSVAIAVTASTVATVAIAMDAGARDATGTLAPWSWTLK